MRLTFEEIKTVSAALQTLIVTEIESVVIVNALRVLDKLGNETPLEAKTEGETMAEVWLSDSYGKGGYTEEVVRQLLKEVKGK